MKRKTRRILTILHVISWIIFVGLCIRTGAMLYSFFVSLFKNPSATKNLYAGLNLSDLHAFNVGHYTTVVMAIILVSALKAYIFYTVIRIFSKINFVHPFSEEVSLLISRVSYIALGIGILTLVANIYCDWLVRKGASLPDLHHYLGAGVEHLLLGGAMFMIAQVFKRGIEIQSENELTV